MSWLQWLFRANCVEPQTDSFDPSGRGPSVFWSSYVETSCQSFSLIASRIFHCLFTDKLIADKHVPLSLSLRVSSLQSPKSCCLQQKKNTAMAGKVPQSLVDAITHLFQPQPDEPAVRLTTFPPEIKSMVLSNMPDIESLRNLVHASPEYHAVYVTQCNKIFTRATFATLLSRGADLMDFGPLVRFRVDIYKKPFPPLQRYAIPPPFVELKRLLLRVYRHNRCLEKLSTVDGHIVLELDECFLLLSILNLISLQGDIHMFSTPHFYVKERCGITVQFHHIHEPAGPFLEVRLTRIPQNMCYLGEIGTLSPANNMVIYFVNKDEVIADGTKRAGYIINKGWDTF